MGLYAASLAWASAGAVATEVAKKPAPAKIGGFVLKGEDSYSAFGHSVRGAGDVNGDGISDLILGAPAVPWDRTLEEGTGKSYVVFGSATGFPTAPEISALDGSNGFVLEGIAVGDSTGYSVDGAGDVNGDGVDDLIIGASSTPVGSGTGFVVYGSRLGFPALVRLSSLNGINGFFLRGIPWEPAGDSVSGAGDVNGDGIDDLVIAAPGGHSGATPDPRQQDFYVVFGSAAGFPLLSYLSAINGSNGFGIKVEDASILQANLRSAAVGSAGDVNGDGIDDLVFGASQADPDGRLDAGESYVVFGSTAGFPVSLDFPAVIELGPLQPVSVLVYGDCPGTVYFRAQGLTANGPYARIVSSLRGSAPITLGACTDVQTGLATTWLHGSDVADGSGSAQYGKSGVEVCGGFMQVIDLTTCELSEVVPLLPEAAAAGEAAAES